MGSFVPTAQNHLEDSGPASPLMAPATQNGRVDNPCR